MLMTLKIRSRSPNGIFSVAYKLELRQKAKLTLSTCFAYLSITTLLPLYETMNIMRILYESMCIICTLYWTMSKMCVYYKTMSIMCILYETISARL